MALIYCKECGRQISDQAYSCPHCGCPLRAYNPYSVEPRDPNKSSCDWLVTLLLNFFLGYLGIHSFYVGKTAVGVAQLLTLGGCGIWALIDFIMILVGSYRDGEGKLIRNR